ncbi:hypothetical protein GCM10009676_23190 [Prauserella halophila]|uniref:PE family protein n=1 Tax=Prauserella halophila TaxID=185641 RepID=A0ABN1W6L3_9PSEU|nr:hypothetical protein [Prauserella halophila]MCP2235493.1 hypothetical protein [Prauserella halophila]
MGNSSQADAAAFRQAAVNGQVGIDPDHAETVLNKIRTGKDAVEALLQKAQELSTPPQIGANPVGNAMATKFSDAAGGNRESYADALRNLHRQYDDAEQAITTAMRRYRDIDEDNAQPFTGQL